MLLELINPSMLAAFIPTFFFVSATPGMCMTLSMTLGMTIGVKRTLWMMLGELIGVGLVVILSMIGVASILVKYPSLFTLFKWLGGLYLLYIGIGLWRSKGRLAISQNGVSSKDSILWHSLITQGFVTAVANPKGWAFFIALLPPFLDQSLPLAPQLSVLLVLILVIEFICLALYAKGGQSLASLLQKKDNVVTMNRIAGILMIGVATWLVTS